MEKLRNCLVKDRVLNWNNESKLSLIGVPWIDTEAEWSDRRRKILD